MGEEKNEREEMCELAAGMLPANKPRYLMGVGTPLDILEAVHRGVDMFDCIIPTQLAQRGVVFTSAGIVQLRRGVYKFDERARGPGRAPARPARASRELICITSPRRARRSAGSSWGSTISGFTTG